jgi:O-glycosyl hydrolase
MLLSALLCMSSAIEVIQSTQDGAHALSPRPALAWVEAAPGADRTHIEVDPGQRFQRILGMGGSLEHATCENLSKLGEAGRAEVIEKLVHPEKGIGMNLMRLCIGTSDFVGEPWYSYSEPPDGELDLDLKHFSIEKDRGYLLDAIKIARDTNPDLLFFASPWSPPAWMKTNGSMLAGKMKPEYYGVYAQYFLRYLQAYADEGIAIHAVTPQNEPGFPNMAYPTCLWRAEEQLTFVRDHLGPVLRGAGLDTRIWCWDHNWNRLDFPRTIFADAEAAKYVEGTGFHLYEGEVTAQSEIKAEFPDKDVFFTEGSVFGTSGALKIIDIFRNWARSYNAWVLMLDEHRKPNNGPHNASATCIELKDNGTVEYRFDYYMMGQFMKYIPRDSVRIASTAGDRRWGNVAFLRPDGKTVAVFANADRKPLPVAVISAGKHFSTELPARSVTTFLW